MLILLPHLVTCFSLTENKVLLYKKNFWNNFRFKKGKVQYFIKQENYKDPTEIMDFQKTAGELILVRKHAIDHKIVMVQR